MNKEIENLIQEIRDTFPLTPEERINYILKSEQCFELIYNLEPEELNNLLKFSEMDIIKAIIGREYCSQVNNSKVEHVRNLYHNKCAVCKFPLKEVLDAHHIIPKHLCGKNDTSNLIALCPTCHRIFHIIEKSGEVNEALKEYLNEKGFLETVNEYTKHLLKRL